MAEPSDSITTMDSERSVARHRPVRSSLGAIVAAVLASLCCIGPVLFVTLGVGASLARTFEPLRPVFTILAVALIAAGFYSVYGRRKSLIADAACEADGVCSVARSRTQDKVVLWVATFIALVLLTSPEWSLWIV